MNFEYFHNMCKLYYTKLYKDKLHEISTEIDISKFEIDEKKLQEYIYERYPKIKSDYDLLSSIYYSSCIANPYLKYRDVYVPKIIKGHEDIIEEANKYRDLKYKSCNGLKGMKLCCSAFEKLINKGIIKSLDNKKDIITFYPSSSSTFEPDKAHVTSLLHLLVVPNPTNSGRIYNAINLNGGDCDLLINMVVRGLTAAIKERPKVINRIQKLYERSRVETLHNFLGNSSSGMFKPFEKPDYPNWKISILPDIKKLEGETYKEFQERFTNEYTNQKRVIGCDLNPLVLPLWSIDDRNGKIVAPKPHFIVGFHVHPNHSVGLLHMHIIDLTLLTSNSMHNVVKTIPWNFFLVK